MREYDVETVSGEFWEAFEKSRKKLTSREVIFLSESNAIEDVTDSESLFHAMKAWQYIKEVKALSIETVLQTHKILMQNQALSPEEKGQFRKRPVFIRYKEKLNWEEVPSNILSWTYKMNLTADQTYDKENEEQLNKELHVQYEEIHPFADGNGRTGRIFMNWWRLKRGMPILVIENSKKQDYYVWFQEIGKSIKSSG